MPTTRGAAALDVSNLVSGSVAGTGRRADAGPASERTYVLDAIWVSLHTGPTKIGGTDMPVKGRTLDEYIDKYRTTATPEEVEVFDEYIDRYSLAGQILEARKNAGLTQIDLAARTGIGQSELSRIERGIGNPTEDTLAKIGRAMNMRLAFVEIPPSA